MIVASGEPLRGNLCYDDLQTDFATRAPKAETRPKRDRLRLAVGPRRRMLEVGVNGGHSAYVALTANPHLAFHGVDVCEHAYVRPAIELLKEGFPGRVFFSEGNSLAVLRDLAENGHHFDMFHIDGAKHLYFKDILNCSRIIDGKDATVVVDDTQLRSVAWTWRTSVRYRLIKADPQNPPGPPDARDQNAIGTLRALPAWKWNLMAHVHANVPVLANAVRTRGGRSSDGEERGST